VLWLLLLLLMVLWLPLQHWLARGACTTRW
jgi:hypothetical protein